MNRATYCYISLGRNWHNLNLIFYAVVILCSHVLCSLMSCYNYHTLLYCNELHVARHVVMYCDYWWFNNYAFSF